MIPPMSAHRNGSSPRAGDPILLAHSYFLQHDPKQVEKMKPYPPLATLLAASTLRARGFDVRLFDAMLAEGVDDFVRVLDEVRPTLVGIFEDNFNFLTKMCTVRTREAAHEMIRAAKAVGARVAVNGSDASDRPGLYLAAGADVVIAGEVEETAAELFALWGRDPGAPLGSDVISKFEAAYENVGIFEHRVSSPGAGRLVVNLTTDDEDDVFGAITATAFFMTGVPKSTGQPITLIELYMQTTTRAAAGRFHMTPADAEAINAKRVSPSAYFVQKVLY